MCQISNPQDAELPVSFWVRI